MNNWPCKGLGIKPKFPFLLNTDSPVHIPLSHSCDTTCHLKLSHSNSNDQNYKSNQSEPTQRTGDTSQGDPVTVIVHHSLEDDWAPQEK